VSLAEVTDAFRRWLHLPDAGALYAMLGTVAANRLEGDPVWLLLVGPPGGGKSEMLGALSELDDVHPTATLTEAALLSGTPKKDRDPAARGGLLRSIGNFGIIVSKDFGSVLSMNRDQRALVLAALREVYDGSWTRHVGTDGGRSLSWAGKVGFIGGCTPTIDRHHAVMGAMGERFVLYRLPVSDPATQARQALAHAGQERRMRAELAGAVVHLLKNLDTEPSLLTSEEVDRLIGLATLVVRARSAVERDGYSREIELVPDAEAPTRLVVVLERLLNGLDFIGLDRDHGWRVITKAALDSIPALRLAVLTALHGPDRTLDTTAVANLVRYPTSTARRALEDLTAHGLVERYPEGTGKADLWTLSDFAQERMKGLPETSEHGRGEGIPETSEEPLFLPLRVEEDISGKVGAPADQEIAEDLLERHADIAQNGSQPDLASTSKSASELPRASEVPSP
jgi:hypothetical protein